LPVVSINCQAVCGIADSMESYQRWIRPEVKAGEKSNPLWQFALAIKEKGGPVHLHGLCEDALLRGVLAQRKAHLSLD